MNFKLFRDACPPKDGYYNIQWFPGDIVSLVYLKRVPTISQVAHEVYQWFWAYSPQDELKSIFQGVVYSLEIQWAEAEP